MTHSHPCSICGVKTECPGEWERNHDGIPAVICTFMHQPGGSMATLRCEDCAGIQICEGCGESPAVKVLEDADDASGYRGNLALCAICLGA